MDGRAEIQESKTELSGDLKTMLYDILWGFTWNQERKITRGMNSMNMFLSFRHRDEKAEETRWSDEPEGESRWRDEKSVIKWMQRR